MKAFKLFIIGAVAMSMALFAAPASAQGEHGRNMDPKEIAVRRADRMRKALLLDEKTYRKVLKWCENDAEHVERQDAKLRKILGPADYEKWKSLSSAAGHIRNSQRIK